MLPFRIPLSRGVIGAAAAVALTVPLLVNFAHVAQLSRELARERARVSRENVALAAQNDNYRRDIIALVSGAAAEEDARSGGYAKPEERVYLVGEPSPQPPTPSPTTTPRR